MKKLIFAFALLFSSLSFASGKLSLQVNAYDQGKHYRPMVGLAIYEKLMKFRSLEANLNSWTGYGDFPLETKPDTHWFTTKNQIDLIYKKFTVSPGVQLYYIKPDDVTRTVGFVRLSYQLW